MGKQRLLLGSAGFAVAISMSATPAYAQDADGASDSNIIIVTATKRETQLETTPLTINVVSGDDLVDSGVGEIKGLSATVPGFTLNEAPSGFSGVSIRGIGTSAGSQAFEQSVGLFVDGVYHPRAHQYRDALFDVERVEVVKGSQGVLFGKNTSIGAVSVVSRGPGSESGGHIQGDYEVNFGSYSIDAGIDAVPSDTFKFRIAALYEEFGGFFENVTLNRDEQTGDRLALRGVFELEPTAGVSVKAKTQISFLDTIGDTFEHISDVNPLALQALGVLDGGQTNFVSFSDNGPFGDSFQEFQSQDHSLEINIDIGDHTLTSVTGYSRFTWENQIDADFTPAPIATSRFVDRYNQFSQEIRLTSPNSDTLEYIFGVFYLNSDVDVIGSSDLLGFGPFTGEFDNVFGQTQDTYAFFGQATWHIAENLQLNVGGRYTIDEKTGTFQRVFLDDFGVPGGPMNALPFAAFTTPAVPLVEDVSDETFDFSVGLSYNPTPESTIYVSVGQGNKGSGFFNTIPLTLLPTSPLQPDPFVLPVERVTTIEGGIKGRFLDGRLYLSVAAYYLDIKNFQDSFFDAPNLQFVVRSLDAKSAGVEAEAAFDITDGINLYGNFAWNPEAELETGFRQQRAPRFTSNLGLKFNTDLSEDITVSGFGQWQHSSSFLHQPEDFPFDFDSLSFDLFSARLELTHKPSQLSFFVLGENLSNDTYRTFLFGGVFPGTGNPGALNPPRQVTFGIRKEF